MRSTVRSSTCQSDSEKGNVSLPVPFQEQYARAVKYSKYVQIAQYVSVPDTQCNIQYLKYWKCL